MKYTLLIIALSIFWTVGIAQTTPDNVNNYTINKRQHNFGKVQKDVPVSVEFTITNNSATDSLIIKKAKGKCGCTATGFPKQPIAPSESVPIKVTYNASTLGDFRKGITIWTNFKKEPDMVFVTGTVVEAQKQ